jgi:flagellar biosynthesis/type III secretory pathway protein FliH
MTYVATIKMDSQIKSIHVVSDPGQLGGPSGLGDAPMGASPPSPAQINHAASIMEVEALKNQLQQQHQLLDSIVTKLTEHYETALSAHREDIAKLSVEIARKILMQKVEDQDYDIEAVIQQALSHAPCNQDVVIHVSPADNALCQELQQTHPNSTLANIQFVADDAIAPAECLVETPKGSVKSCIDDHLEQIAKALIKGS